MKRLLSKIMRILLSIFFLTVAAAATAQDREGNNTPGEWVVTHHAAFGLWDSMCDERVTGDIKEERCYIRYVDVFSPRPNFAAQFVFVTPEQDGYKVEFGVERGTTFVTGGFQIRNGNDVIWQNNRKRCLLNACSFIGTDADELLAAMQAGDEFAFAFNDRHGADQTLSWDLSAFADILADFHTESRRRGLLG